MIGLNLHTVTIGTVMLTIALHVHGYGITPANLRNEMNLSKFKLGDSDVDFHISSDRRDWAGSTIKCLAGGGQLANLDDETEKEALILALKHKNYSDETRFWIHTCSHGNDVYCDGRCTEVTYTKRSGLKTRILSGADCKVKKQYICES